MGLYQSRHDQALSCLYDPLAGSGMKVYLIPLSDFRYLSVPDPDAAVSDIRSGHSLDQSSDDIHLLFPLVQQFFRIHGSPVHGKLQVQIAPLQGEILGGRRNESDHLARLHMAALHDPYLIQLAISNLIAVS